MGGKSTLSPFRVFGSPYTVLLHQHVTYLRLKQLPFKVYCANFTTTLLYSLYYRAKNSFCTVTPSGASCLQVWQLAESTELDEDAEAIARSVKGEVSYTSAANAASTAVSADAPRTQRFLLSRATHPQLHLASWCIVVYASWWLAKTGAMYRYVRGDSLDVLEGYVRYFFLIPGVGLARATAPRFRDIMKLIVAAAGLCPETAPFMEEHFMRFCAALEAHFSEHPACCFLLGTPHPTLADVTVGAVFSSYFFMDDPPASQLTERFPRLTEYVERVTGWRGHTFVDTPDDSPDAAASTAEEGGQKSEAGTGRSSEADAKRASPATPRSPHASRDHPDVVPESLAPCFELIAEVFPFLMSQCASFNAFMTGDGVRTLKREALEGEWKGCSGYLLPQLTNIKSLMIVDDNVVTTLTRAQDLEVAFLASREVLDDALRDFGRQDGSEEAMSTPPSRGNAATETTRELPHASALQVDRSAGAAAPMEDPSRKAVTAAEAASPPTATEAAAGEEEDEMEDISHVSSLFQQAVDLRTLKAEDADFYRAYSEAGRRRLGGGNATTLSEVMPSARHTADASEAAATSTAADGQGVVVHRSEVTERLAVLKSMLGKMRCPQYTLTTVFQGRRMYVAAIPEYEVAKKRKERQQAAARAAAK